MKVAVLSEGDHDELLVRGLVEATLGRSTQRVEPVLRSRIDSWPRLRDELPRFVLALHWWSDAEGLVVVADSDDADVCQPDCRDESHDHRLRDLRAAALDARPIKERPMGRPPLRVAIGVAVPAIEAWALHGRGDALTERNWRERIAPGLAGRAELKRRCYGSTTSLLATRQDVMRKRLPHLCRDLDGLRRAFPVGFGGLVDDLRSWTT